MSGIEQDANPCYYCGLPADTIDHVIPRSILKAVRRSGDEILTRAIVDRRRTYTVAACRECNGLAGATYHETLEERVAYVRHRLAKRHRSALATPDWTPRELFTLSRELRNRVIAALHERDLTRRRLRYRDAGLTPDMGDTYWAGNDSEIESAGRPGPSTGRVEPITESEQRLLDGNR
jgi:hypothetical protein